MGQEGRRGAVRSDRRHPDKTGPDRHGRRPGSSGPIGSRPVGCCLAFRFERIAHVPPSHASTADSKPAGPSGGVQSLERAFDLLERMADAGGEVGLSELSASSGLPLPTIHRLMRTLVVCGYVRQQPNRRYALGPRLIRLGESASRLLGTWARPYLSWSRRPARPRTWRCWTGTRSCTSPRCRPSTPCGCSPRSAAGSSPTPPAWARRSSRTPRPTRSARCSPVRACQPATEKTITTPEGFLDALEQVRRAGYAVDDNEQEIGVRCLAVSVPNSPTSAAISISGWRDGSRRRPRNGSCRSSSRSPVSCPTRWRATGRTGAEAA